MPISRALPIAGLVPLLASLALLLGGCAASTQLVHNDKASAEVKARSFKSYKEVLLVPPAEDKRNVVPRTKAELEAMGFTVRVMDPSKPIEAAQGTAFVISAAGHVLTCAHVLGEIKEATLTLDGKRYFADVLKADKDADLALLKLRESLPAGAALISFRGSAKSAAMGEEVYTIGYPLSRLLGSGARMSRGLVSAANGLRDDPKQLQVSAEIHPGNSGGPLLDREGQAVGVISQTINPWRVVQATGGALPQNINFAIKNEPTLAFLKGADSGVFDALAFDKAGGLERANRAVARIQAGIVADDAERRDKMVVRLNYVSLWDVWYRFRFFVLAAFDFETQEPLFAAGQGRDNLVSNEEVVMKDTFDQFRKAIASR
jgi:serine protease Do